MRYLQAMSELSPSGLIHPGSGSRIQRCPLCPSCTLGLSSQQEVNSKDPLLLLETNRDAEEKKIPRTQQGRKRKKRARPMLKLRNVKPSRQDEARYFLGLP